MRRNKEGPTGAKVEGAFSFRSAKRLSLCSSSDTMLMSVLIGSLVGGVSLALVPPAELLLYLALRTAIPDD